MFQPPGVYCTSIERHKLNPCANLSELKIVLHFVEFHVVYHLRVAWCHSVFCEEVLCEVLLLHSVLSCSCS